MPEAHDSHPPGPSDPVVPALQVHSFEDDPVFAENFPAAHAVHTADPAAALYLPESHDNVQAADPDAVL